MMPLSLTASSTRVYFSIAIPAFKGTFLKECIASILAQDYPLFEIIVVNDQSPEDLGNVVHEFDDSRITYIKNEVGFGGYHVTKNWDECLKYAHGNYFICMGDDDRLLPSCLSNYVKLIHQYPECLVYHTRSQIIDENSDIIGLQCSRPLCESVYSHIWHRWNCGVTTYIGDYLFKTESLRNNGGFYWMPFGRYSDYLSVWSILKDRHLVNMQEFGFQYRSNPHTLTHRTDNQIDKIEAERLLKTWMYNFLTQEPKDETDCIYRHLLKQDFQAHFRERFRMVIKDDFCYNGITRLLFWIKEKKKYGLTVRDIFICLLIGIYKRFRQS